MSTSSASSASPPSSPTPRSTTTSPSDPPSPGKPSLAPPAIPPHLLTALSLWRQRHYSPHSPAYHAVAAHFAHLLETASPEAHVELTHLLSVPAALGELASLIGRQSRGLWLPGDPRPPAHIRARAERGIHLYAGTTELGSLWSLWDRIAETRARDEVSDRPVFWDPAWDAWEEFLELPHRPREDASMWALLTVLLSGFLCPGLLEQVLPGVEVAMVRRECIQVLRELQGEGVGVLEVENEDLEVWIEGVGERVAAGTCVGVFGVSAGEMRRRRREREREVVEWEEGLREWEEGYEEERLSKRKRSEIGTGYAEGKRWKGGEEEGSEEEDVEEGLKRLSVVEAA